MSRWNPIIGGNPRREVRCNSPLLCWSSLFFLIDLLAYVQTFKDYVSQPPQPNHGVVAMYHAIESCSPPRGAAGSFMQTKAGPPFGRSRKRWAEMAAPPLLARVVKLHATLPAGLATQSIDQARPRKSCAGGSSIPTAGTPKPQAVPVANSSMKVCKDVMGMPRRETGGGPSQPMAEVEPPRVDVVGSPGPPIAVVRSQVIVAVGAVIPRQRPKGGVWKPLSQ